jgi:small-conductance mechanosensitive channel
LVLVLESLSTLFSIVLPLIGLVIAAEVFLVVLNRVIKPLILRTKTTLDDRMVAAVEEPVRMLGVLLGVYFTMEPLVVGDLFYGKDFGFWFQSVLMLWTGHLLSKVANALIVWYMQEYSVDPKHRAQLKINKDMIPILRWLVRITIYLITLIIILQRFGVEITPLVTALGIGGLAVALALQSTLSSFFAGFYLLSDRPIRGGEFIALEDENAVTKGFVEEIGWRMTRIRTRGNYTYFVPNEKITSTSIVNFSRGIQNNWKGASLTVSVKYGSNVAKVKKVLKEAVHSVQRRDPKIAKSEPVVRLERFGDSALEFKVLYEVNNYFETELVASEVREEILKGLAREGIEIPFTTYHVLLKDDGEKAKGKKRQKKLVE